VIRSNGFSPLLSAMSLLQHDARMKTHAAYKSAKAGERYAALELVVDLAVAWIGGLRNRFKPGLFYLAPHAQEATEEFFESSSNHEWCRCLPFAYVAAVTPCSRPISL
jgi:hypothetical protein